MKKSTIFLISTLWILFMIIIITRPYELNYNLDEEKGMNNIIAKIKDLAENDSIFEIHIETRCEQRDMDFLTLYVENPENRIHTQIFLNRSGAFTNSVNREETDGRNYAKLKYYDISNLSQNLTLIDDCKKLIPKSYQFRHTEYIAVRRGGIAIIKIAVTPQDENNIEKSSYVHLKTHKKTVRRRRGSDTTQTFQYYVMEFAIDENRKISIE